MIMKFKVGDKVRCVDNSKYDKQLTLGKVYTVLEEDTDLRYVRVKPDHMITVGGYKVERFELVQENAVLTPEEVFEHLRKGTKLQWRYKAKDRWQDCINSGNVQVRCILDSEWRIKPEPEIIELNGKKYIEIME